MWERLPGVWRAVVEESWSAYCAGSVPHGAVITDATGRIVARGRNRVGEQHGPEGQIFGNKLAHAEINALLKLDWHAIDSTTCILFAAAEPCDHCAAALLVARIGTVDYGSRDPVGGRADLLTANSHLRPQSMLLIPPARADLELLLMGLRAAYWLRCGAREAYLVDTWRTVVPEAINLGERLNASGKLNRLCIANAPGHRDGSTRHERTALKMRQEIFDVASYASFCDAAIGLSRPRANHPTIAITATVDTTPDLPILRHR